MQAENLSIVNFKLVANG